MIETNVRIVNPGSELKLTARLARVRTLDHSPASIKRICGKLRYNQGLPATPAEEQQQILVLASDPVGTIELQEQDQCVQVKDAEQSRTLRFARAADRETMSRLLQQQLIRQTHQVTDLWTLDSPRIFYESTPKARRDKIAAYQRFDLTSIPIDGVGVGIAVDARTAFFTTESVAWFFDENLSDPERERRRKRFERLSERQKGQKGTLLYILGDRSRGKCYFEEYLDGVRCDDPMTGRSFGGTTYDSLFDYYQRRYGHLDVSPDDPVAMVSFSNGPGPVPVSARLLRLRVMNDMLPDRLKGKSQLEPYPRKRTIIRFWEKLGEKPFGEKNLTLYNGFWKPDRSRVFPPPALEFGDDKVADAPDPYHFQGRKNHYDDQKRLLDKHGCFEAHSTIPRTIHFCAPEEAGREATRRLAREMTKHLSNWTDRPIEPEVSLFESRTAQLAELSNKDPQMVVFVFEDDHPSAYYLVEHELSDARVKRIKLQTLKESFTSLQAAEKGANGHRRSQRDWRHLVENSALDVLQQLNCAPWTIGEDLHYDAQLAIDVGPRRRSFALSLLVCKGDSPKSDSERVVLDTQVVPKPNSDQEKINGVVLRKHLVSLFEDNGYAFLESPIASLLVLRDGRECGDELEAIQEAKQILSEAGLMRDDVSVDVVDFHKKTLKGIRIWDNDDGFIRQAFEGASVFLDDRTAALINTGAPTLRQGTASPLLLKAQTEGVEIEKMVRDVHACSHLNWTSPGIAQRRPLTIKRTDDELQSRASKEVLRVS